MKRNEEVRINNFTCKKMCVYIVYISSKVEPPQKSRIAQITSVKLKEEKWKESGNEKPHYLSCSIRSECVRFYSLNSDCYANRNLSV